MPTAEHDTETIVRFLSHERLSALVALTASPADAIDLHQETLRVGAGLMNVIATVEIAVRNSVNRADIAIQLEKIYQARNRLAHHEPVLHKRFADTVEAIRFVVERLDTASPNPNTPLATLVNRDLADVCQRAADLHAKLETYRRG